MRLAPLSFRLAVAALAMASLSYVTPASSADASHNLLKGIKLDSRGPVDVFRIDPASRRLFVARSGGIEVIDIDAGKKVGQLDLKGTVSAITLSADLGRGYASQAGENAVTTFDPASLKIISTEKLSGEPGSMVFDPDTKQVYVSGMKDGQLTAINGVTGKTAGMVALGGNLKQAVVDTRGGLFVADAANNVIHVVDTKAMKSLGKIPTWPAEKPAGLVLDNAERRIYVAAENNRMVIIDPDAGQMIGQVETKAKGSTGITIQYAPARLAWLVMPAADGNVSIIKNAKLTATLDATIAANVKSTSVDFDPKDKRFYLGGDSELLVIGK
ncbi:MAG: hypothetical protein CFE29_06720 [Bradyrhizobiaceae bacterium PARB1]|jgi:DNA-binding beta-propeller fold protein YncE|nr:MAG: hypothetical protein CFE29_06720 [Bradyrhizobiaceae bacterium PARB1]